MSNKQNSNLIGALVLVSGMIIGAAGAIFYKENRPMNAGKILENVKQIFATEGEIIGSWIDYDAVEYTGFDSQPLVYVGGITRMEKGKPVHYSFSADIYTGEILNTYTTH
ncbi:hypothetical protein HZY91_07615 [Facklamia sp. DSM 111018]|uniref:PepSY domain-containing protein n=1 Tax=Facklamia lactis TaxID=2749967 RepID=A0ABS0LRH9_9LACT|nr:hypothetical protein [Facklamia lactis]MBG9980874.1 hypothetical protein [Facklamia lactis]MBG9986763.1 hypothetical protein [Facklamia lactis]